MPDTSAGYKFVMSFVSASDKYRSQFVDKWQEVIANFVVDGAQTIQGGEWSPYNRSKVFKSNRNKIFLRDPETHKLVMTYASKLVRAVLGDRDGEFIKAQPVGWEDAVKSRVVNKLLRYDFNLPGHFRTLVEAVVDMLLIGTSVIENYWKFEEKEILVRTFESDGVVEAATISHQKVPVYDDPCIRNVDVMDFYPDPARYRMEEMSGCAKGFRMNAFEAQRLAENGYYSKTQTDMALGRGQPGAGEGRETSFREGLDQPLDRKPVTEFKEMKGYEYWGEVPAECEVKDDETGELITRGVVTVLNEHVVRARKWPLVNSRLPFYTFIINPVQGRFYGISPAETIRFDQSFTDAMKILMAEAVIRQVHPPIAYDPDSDINDLSKLRDWKADLPIAVRGGPAAIGTLKYGADTNAGWNMISSLKADIQGGSGALGAIQGDPGPDRESATAASSRVQFAMDRPELAGMILERECLPPLAVGMLKLNQQFLEDTDDLAKRVGELPAPFWIGDILVDFDIQCIGSRNAVTKQEKLQSFDRLTAYSATSPAFAAMLPNQQIAQWVVGDLLGLEEIAGMAGDPQTVALNMMLQQISGQQGGPAQNGVPAQAEPAGMLPAQASGG